jgi:hypothetical protein
LVVTSSIDIAASYDGGAVEDGPPASVTDDTGSGARANDGGANSDPGPAAATDILATAICSSRNRCYSHKNDIDTEINH